MLIILKSEKDIYELEIDITKTLHDLHLAINELLSINEKNYTFDFGNCTYSYEGDRDSNVHHCDLFIYRNEPVLYTSNRIVLEITHNRISKDIYDYCDFHKPHYCSALEKVIDIDMCFDDMMCLGRYFTIESCPELNEIKDIDIARIKCDNCIYSNCDDIDLKGILKNI